MYMYAHVVCCLQPNLLGPYLETGVEGKPDHEVADSDIDQPITKVDHSPAVPHNV